MSSSEKSEERTIRIGGNGHAFAPDLIASGRPGPTTDRPSFPGAHLQTRDSNRCCSKKAPCRRLIARRQFLRPSQNLDVAFFVPTVSSDARFNSSPPSTSGGSPRLTQMQPASLFQPYGALPVNVFSIHPPQLVKSGACLCLFSSLAAVSGRWRRYPFEASDSAVARLTPVHITH